MTTSGQDLKAEAESIIERLGLLPLLSEFGEAAVVGSVALDLLVKPDIDLCVVISGQNLMGAALEITQRVLDVGIREVRVTDYRGRSGIKLGIDRYPGPSGDWSIDIWVTPDRATTGVALAASLLQRLTPEHRQAILRIKERYNHSDQLRDGISTVIYDAVVEHGVRNAEEFEVFRTKKK